MQERNLNFKKNASSADPMIIVHLVSILLGHVISYAWYCKIKERIIVYEKFFKINAWTTI